MLALFNQILEVLYPPNSEAPVFTGLTSHELAEGVEAQSIRLLIDVLDGHGLVDTVDYDLGVEAARGEMDVVRAPSQVNRASPVTMPTSLHSPLFKQLILEFIFFF